MVSSDVSLPASGEEFRQHDMAAVLVFLTAIIGGVIAGVLLWVSWRYYYLLLFSPVIAAGVAVMFMGPMIKFTHMRNLTVITVCSILMGLILYSTLWIGKYIYAMDQYRDSVSEEIKVERPHLEVDDEKINQIIEDYFEDETGQRGFIGYVMLEAKDGMTITPHSASAGPNTDTNIGTPLTVLYWIGEVFIILRLILKVTRAETKKYQVVAPSLA